MNNITIRLAEPADFKQIWPFFQEIIKDADSYMYSPEMTEQEACASWFNPQETIYVAQIKGRIVGTFGIRPNWTGLGDHIANASFMVDKKARGQGIGTYMLKFCLNIAQKRGFKAMQFNAVVSTNKAALHLWQKNGFQIIGQVPKAFHLKQKKYVDTYIMYRPL